MQGFHAGFERSLLLCPSGRSGRFCTGRALCIPKSKLSRRIALLEDRLGVRLIQRSTRHFRVTEVGRTYYGHCKAMLVEAEAAQAAIDTLQSEPSGTIRMACPTTLLHAHAGSMLGFGQKQLPVLPVRTLRHTEEERREPFHGGLTAASLPPTSSLGTSPVTIAISGGYFGRYP
ncbi:LysR family transcriptional regulator [Methylomonas sp. MgM2]